MPIKGHGTGDERNTSLPHPPGSGTPCGAAPLTRLLLVTPLFLRADSDSLYFPLAPSNKRNTLRQAAALSVHSCQGKACPRVSVIVRKSPPTPLTARLGANSLVMGWGGGFPSLFYNRDINYKVEIGTDNLII